MKDPSGDYHSPTATVIITDLGGVLVDYNGEAMVRDIGKLCRASPEEVGYFFEGGSRDAFEVGLISPVQFFETAKVEIGFAGSYEDFVNAYTNPALFGLNQEVYDLYFLELKRRNSVEFWALSNVNALHYEYLLRRWPGIFYNCRRVFLSFELGLRKPDPEIFRKVIELSGGHARFCLFVDGLEENVAAAKNCEILTKRGNLVISGDHIDAIRFESVEQLKSKFRTKHLVFG